MFNDSILQIDKNSTRFRKDWKDKAKDYKDKAAVNKNCYKRRNYGG